MAHQLREAVQEKIFELQHQLNFGKAQQVEGLLMTMQSPVENTMAEQAKTAAWLDTARRFHRIAPIKWFAIHQAKRHQALSVQSFSQFEPILDQAIAVQSA